MPDTSTKITFKEWVKHPTTAMLVAVMAIASFLVQVVIRNAGDSNKECMEQVMYLRERVGKLEKQVDQYTTTIMALRGVNTKLADSLASKGGSK